jgi:DNA-binding NarL/FixJ family response regulator
MIRVVLADDQALVRAGFRALLDAQDDIEVVGEAGDGEQAVSLATELTPDVVLMDIRMPGTDGLAATRRISADGDLAGVRVVILTTFELDEYVFEAIGPGPAGSWSRTPSRMSWCRRSGWWPAATPCCLPASPAG